MLLTGSSRSMCLLQVILTSVYFQSYWPLSGKPIKQTTNQHLLNGPLSRTTYVSWNQKGKPVINESSN